MNNILFLSIDKILYIIMALVIFFEDSFDSFEKSLLILMVAILISLTNIKEVIKNSNK